MFGQSAVDILVKLLDVDVLGEDRFVGVSHPGGRHRLFGGQVAAQSLAAAGRTVDPERMVNSIHGNFVRPGDPDQPIVFAVERVRDGRSFSVRRCVAMQNDVAIFVMSASFHRPENGLEHQAVAPARDSVPWPEELPRMTEVLARYPGRLEALASQFRPVDVRYVGEESGWIPPGHRSARARQRAWLRVDGTLPDGPLLHACALTYASDISLLDSVLNVHGEVWGPGGYVGASLDHSLWLHRPLRADEWLLYDCESPSASDARGLAIGRLFDRDGRHVATAAQEGMLRKMGD
jgi:acyl-CoA thioesterase II